MNSALASVIESLKETFLNSIKDVKEFRGEATLFIPKRDVLKICGYLKDEQEFTFLADLTAVDYLKVKLPRYEVVYHVHRFGDDFEGNVRVRLKAEVSEDELRIDSVTSVWSGANWLEREVYDMFGIEFSGHPNLKRILMPEDYEPFPLRKDFDVRDRKASKESFERALKDGLD